MPDEAPLPKLVHEDQPPGKRFWVREDSDYYASFAYVVMDGPSKYDSIAGFNEPEPAYHYAELMEIANKPEV